MHTGNTGTGATDGFLIYQADSDVYLYNYESGSFILGTNNAHYLEFFTTPYIGTYKKLVVGCDNAPITPCLGLTVYDSTTSGATTSYAHFCNGGTGYTLTDGLIVGSDAGGIGWIINREANYLKFYNNNKQSAYIQADGEDWYFVYDISVLSITDRTEFPETIDKAKLALKSMKNKTGTGKIDYDNLDSYLKKSIKNDKGEIEHGRSLTNTVSCLVAVINDLQDRLDLIEKKI
jgi:hypothetical protein